MARLHYRQGLTFARKTCYHRAIAAFTKAATHYPRPAEVYSSRGVARWRMGDIQGAQADFDRAISLNPNHTKTYGNRGLLRYSGSHYG